MVGARVVHPFHPLSGQELAVIGERRSRHGDRVWYEKPDGTVGSIPRAWTDLASLDAFEVVSAGRAHFRPLDLLEVAELIAQRRREKSPGGGSNVSG